MCGICGMIGTDRFEWLEPMSRAMAYRGPDDAGIWTDPSRRVGLGHRRLSIIDVSPAGHQPMSNEDGTVWIAYNGELYDFDRHRDDLLARGHRFKSRSDTEVMIHLYEEYGLDFLGKLNGMFAFALWDARKGELLLARDHAGIKPLYYGQKDGAFFFASEIKALLQIPGFPRELNREFVEEYLTFLWIPGDQTLLRGISKLEPGHYLIWKNGNVEKKRWFNLPYVPDESVGEPEWIERVHDTFMRTTRRQMVSDVPLGAFLSGGLDSSSIAACMRHAFPDRDIVCYTARSASAGDDRDQFADDYPYAVEVARRLNIQLKTCEVEPDVVRLLPHMVWHLEEPDADPAAFPSYLICRFAREQGTTVLLSGTGGDEVFFGYRSHQAYALYDRLDRFLPAGLVKAGLGGAVRLARRFMGAGSAIPRRLGKLYQGLSAQGLERHLALVDWSSPDARRQLLGARATGAVPASLRYYYDTFQGRGAVNRHSHLLVQTFLAAHNFLYTDKTSMANSVEVRVPYMDMELMRLCASIPERFKLQGSLTKALLKKSMERYLPREVLYRKKTGFGVPLRTWMANDLKPYLAEMLSEEQIRKRGLFEAGAVQKIIAENRDDQADHSYLLYALLTLEVWMQTFIDRPGEQVTI